MPTIGDRLEEYRQDMNLLQKDLAILLNTTRQAISNYAGGRTPTYAGLLDMADQLGVTTDWLTGRTSHPKWGVEVQSMRMVLRQRLADVNAPDVLSRMLALTRAVQQLAPITQKEWFMAGIMGLSTDSYRRFQRGQGDGVNLVMLRRFSDFTGIPEQWIMSGRTEDLAFEVDLGEWLALVERFIRWGLTPSEVQIHSEWLHQTVLQHRRLDS